MPITYPQMLLILTRWPILTWEDIESVTVLKDAHATAFYGARGDNGVIIIKKLPVYQWCAI